MKCLHGIFCIHRLKTKIVENFQLYGNMRLSIGNNYIFGTCIFQVRGGGGITINLKLVLKCIYIRKEYSGNNISSK